METVIGEAGFGKSHDTVTKENAEGSMTAKT